MLNAVLVKFKLPPRHKAIDELSRLAKINTQLGSFCFLSGRLIGTVKM